MQIVTNKFRFDLDCGLFVTCGQLLWIACNRSCLPTRAKQEKGPNHQWFCKKTQRN